MKSNRWCFTVNDNPREFYQQLNELFENTDNIKYICGQIERGSETERDHFQGYLQLKTSQRLSWVKNNVHQTAHFEVQRASSNATARDYCKKDDDVVHAFIEAGTFTKGRGQRTDLLDVRAKVMGGARHRDLIEDDVLFTTIVRYRHVYNIVRQYNPPQRPPDLNFQVKLYYGDPGTGKTRRAYEVDGADGDMYVVPLNNGTTWFDGYDGHKTVLFDDFTGRMSHFTLNNTLRLLDRYPIQVPIKGSFTWYHPETVILTTNVHPFNWFDWADRKSQWAALKRRITTVVKYTKFADEVDELIYTEKEDLEQFFEDTMLWRKEN